MVYDGMFTRGYHLHSSSSPHSHRSRGAPPSVPWSHRRPRSGGAGLRFPVKPRENPVKPWKSRGKLRVFTGKSCDLLEMFGRFDDELNGKWMIYMVYPSWRFIGRVVSRKKPKPTFAIWSWHALTSEAQKQVKDRQSNKNCGLLLRISRDPFCIAKLLSVSNAGVWD